MNLDLAFVVENDPDLADLFAISVQMTGLRAVIIPNGQDSLDRILQEQPNLILLDLHLPEISGHEILNLVRSSPQLRSTSVIVITGDALAAEEQIHRGQADLVVVKPVAPSDLRTFIRRITNR